CRIAVPYSSILVLVSIGERVKNNARREAIHDVRTNLEKCSFIHSYRRRFYGHGVWPGNFGPDVRSCHRQAVCSGRDEIGGTSSVRSNAGNWGTRRQGKSSVYFYVAQGSDCDSLPPETVPDHGPGLD